MPSTFCPVGNVGALSCEFERIETKVLQSFSGAKKKEVSLKLKECTQLLKDLGAGTADSMLISVVHHVIEEITSFEKGLELESDICRAEMILRELDKFCSHLEGNCKFNKRLLEETEVLKLEESLESLSVDRTQQLVIPRKFQEIPPLVHERITNLLNSIKEQNEEIISLKNIEIEYGY